MTLLGQTPSGDHSLNLLVALRLWVVDVIHLDVREALVVGFRKLYLRAHETLGDRDPKVSLPEVRVVNPFFDAPVLVRIEK
jgi:hypothetical protein